MTDLPAQGPAVAENPPTPHANRSGRFAAIVAAAILVSRFTGLIRERAINHWLGNSLVGEAFTLALSLPKILQNLLGEGALSASFVPVYSQLVGDPSDDARSDASDTREASELAGGVLGLLMALVAALVLALVILAGPLVALVGRGLDDEKRQTTVELLRIMTPGIGFIVLAAWCIGVLNAHRRFFLSYVAPALWNAAIVAALLVASQRSLDLASIGRWAAWGVLVGGLLQFIIQLPAVWRAAGPILPSLRLTDGVRTVATRFWPAVSGRGVITIAAAVDLALAGFLVNAYRVLGSAQTLYLLPISVFAVSVAAAELPDLSREQHLTDVARQRLAAGTERIALFLVFSAIAFVVAGLPLMSVLFEGGEFGRDPTIAAWLTLAAYALGMVASGQSRLLQNAAFATGDVKGPAWIVFIRVTVAVIVGVILMFQLDRFQIAGGDISRVGSLPAFGPLPENLRQIEGATHLGAVGLGLGASAAAWIELALLQRRLRPTYGQPSFGSSIRHLLSPAVTATAVATALVLALGSTPRLIWAFVPLGAAGLAYLLLAARSSPTAARFVALADPRQLGSSTRSSR